MTVIDLCAGIGGWDLPARWLGLDPIGVEWDPDACATRAVNGLATIRADIARYPAQRFGRIAGLIASPPCPQFSAAGKGLGRLLIAELCAMVDDALAGGRLGVHVRTMARTVRRHLLATTKATRAEAAAQGWATAREAALMAQPARWIRACNPEWVALEQVPDALPVFRHLALRLRDAGWSTDVGVLSAEQFGVPQTRRRAIVVASRVRRVALPQPTHQRFVSGEAQGAGADCQPTLFGPGLVPWVSMADALGWGATARPMLSLAPGTKSGGADPMMLGGSGARRLLDDGRESGRWVARRPRGRGMQDRADQAPGHADRGLDEPAPTILANGGGNASPGFQWCYSRPATTVACDPRLPEAGHHDRQMNNAIRLSIDEAAALQTFPPDFRWGDVTKTAMFRGVGNAVPCLLGLHVLAAVLGIDLCADLALTPHKETA